MKHIVDFDTGCGTLSSVFDGVLDYTVSYNYGLNENNIIPYNLIHLNNFTIEDAPNIDVNFFIGTPHLGNEISKRGQANIDFSEKIKLSWISNQAVNEINVAGKYCKKCNRCVK